MRLIRISAYALCGTALLLVLGFFWLHSASFEYHGSQEKEFVIDAPLSAVCKQAANASEICKQMMNSQSSDSDEPKVKIDVEQAVQSLTIGEPIDCEINHPELGKRFLKIKLNLKYDDGYFLSGKTVSIEPSAIQKGGINVAEIQAIRFTLGIVPKDFEKKFFNLIPNVGTTVVKFSSSTDLKINFREFGFIRATVDKTVAQSQQDVLKQIDAFIQNVFADSQASDSPKSDSQEINGKAPRKVTGKKADDKKTDDANVEDEKTNDRQATSNDATQNDSTKSNDVTQNDAPPNDDAMLSNEARQNDEPDELDDLDGLDILDEPDEAEEFDDLNVSKALDDSNESEDSEELDEADGTNGLNEENENADELDVSILDEE